MCFGKEPWVAMASRASSSVLSGPLWISKFCPAWQRGHRTISHARNMTATMSHKAALESAVHSAVQDILDHLYSNSDATWFNQEMHRTDVAKK
jgi:hypothetical protein